MSDHSEIPEGIHDGLLLFRRTDRSLAVFRLGLVIALAHFQAALLLDLGNVEGGHLQPGVFQNISLIFGSAGSLTIASVTVFQSTSPLESVTTDSTGVNLSQLILGVFSFS